MARADKPKRYCKVVKAGVDFAPLASWWILVHECGETEYRRRTWLGSGVYPAPKRVECEDKPSNDDTEADR